MKKSWKTRRGAVVLPSWPSFELAIAVSRQVVMESAISRERVACPFSSVIKAGFQ